MNVKARIARVTANVGTEWGLTTVSVMRDTLAAIVKQVSHGGGLYAVLNTFSYIEYILFKEW